MREIRGVARREIDAKEQAGALQPGVTPAVRPIVVNVLPPGTKTEPTRALVRDHRRDVESSVWRKIGQGAFSSEFRPQSGIPYDPHARPSRTIVMRNVPAPDFTPNSELSEITPTQGKVTSRTLEVLERIERAITGSKK